MTRRYAAFVSYRHAADGRLAPALVAAVRTFGKAWYRQYAVRTFRDQSGLAVTPALWESIRAGMDASRFFILLASPEAARSEWVGREVRHWLERQSADHLLIVRTGGTIEWDGHARDFDWGRTTALP